MSNEPSYIAPLLQRVTDRLGDAVAATAVHVGQATVELRHENAFAALQTLRDEFAFKQLVDLCGVDYLDHGRSDWEGSAQATSEGFSRGSQTGVGQRDEGLFDFGPAGESSAADANERRYAVVYHLLSHVHNQRLRVRVFTAGEPPRVESVHELWAAADWYEREAFDLYGILFEGHPDLRRLLTDYGFIGHPFRKDFPLSGEVEVRYDAEQRRVIYEPVSIEPRTLVPRVIRPHGPAAQAAAPVDPAQDAAE